MLTFSQAYEELEKLVDASEWKGHTLCLDVEAWRYSPITDGAPHRSRVEYSLYITGACSKRWTASTLDALVTIVRDELAPSPPALACVDVADEAVRRGL